MYQRWRIWYLIFGESILYFCFQKLFWSVSVCQPGKYTTTKYMVMHFVFVFLIYIVFLFVSVFVFQFCILFSEAFCQILFVNQAIICHYWYLQNICSCILYLYLYSYLYFVLLYFCFQKIFCWFSFGNSANLQLLVHLENMLLMHSVFVFFLCFLSVFCTFVFQNLANDIFTI